MQVPSRPGAALTQVRIFHRQPWSALQANAATHNLRVTRERPSPTLGRTASVDGLRPTTRRRMKLERRIAHLATARKRHTPHHARSTRRAVSRVTIHTKARAAVGQVTRVRAIP